MVLTNYLRPGHPIPSLMLGIPVCVRVHCNGNPCKRRKGPDCAVNQRLEFSTPFVMVFTVRIEHLVAIAMYQRNLTISIDSIH